MFLFYNTTVTHTHTPLYILTKNGNFGFFYIAFRSVGGERTVKKLRLSKALTIPEGTTVSDACRRMAARRVDAVLLTDSNALLSGIVTDKVFTKPKKK